MVDDRPPPEGIGKLPTGKVALLIGREERGTAVGFVSCSEAAAAEAGAGAGAGAGAESANWSAVVQALALSDASCTPEFKHFPFCFSAIHTTSFMAPALVHMMNFG